MILRKVLVASIWLWQPLSAAPAHPQEVSITPAITKRIAQAVLPATVEALTPAKSDFNFGVIDVSTNNFQGRQETREGNRVTGSYVVLLPDGSVQKVEYFADDSGFHSQVSHDGTNAIRFPGIEFDGNVPTDVTATTADGDTSPTTTPIPTLATPHPLNPSRLGLAAVSPVPDPSIMLTGIPLSSTGSQDSQPVHFVPVVMKSLSKDNRPVPSQNTANPLDENYDYLEILVVSNPSTQENNLTLNNPLNVNPNFFDFDYILDEIINSTESPIIPKSPTIDISNSIQTPSKTNDFELVKRILDAMNRDPNINAVPIPSSDPSIINSGVPLPSKSQTSPKGPNVDIQTSIQTHSKSNDLQLVEKVLEAMKIEQIINAVQVPVANEGVPLPFPPLSLATEVPILPSVPSLSGDEKLGVPIPPSAPSVVNSGVPLPSESKTSPIEPTIDIPSSIQTLSKMNDLQLLKKVLEAMNIEPSINAVQDPVANDGVPLPFPPLSLPIEVPTLPSVPSLSGDGKLGVPLPPIAPIVVNSGVPLPSEVADNISGVPIPVDINLGIPSSAGTVADIPTLPSLGINEEVIKQMLGSRLQNPLGTTVFIIGQPQAEEATSISEPETITIAPTEKRKELGKLGAPVVISPNPPFEDIEEIPIKVTAAKPAFVPVVSPHHSYPTVHHTLPVSSTPYGNPVIHSPSYGLYGNAHNVGSPYRHYRIRVRRPVKEKSKSWDWDYYYKAFKDWFKADKKEESEDIIIIRQQPHYSPYPSSGPYGIPHSYQSPLYPSSPLSGSAVLSGSAALSSSPFPSSGSILGDPRFNSPLGFGPPLGFNSPFDSNVAFGRLGIPADSPEDQTLEELTDSRELTDGIGSAEGFRGLVGGSTGSGGNAGSGGIGITLADVTGGGIGGGSGGNGGSGGIGISLADVTGGSIDGGSGDIGGGGGGSGGSGGNGDLGVTLADVTGGEGGGGSSGTVVGGSASGGSSGIGNLASGSVGSGGAGGSGASGGGSGASGGGSGSLRGTVGQSAAFASAITGSSIHHHRPVFKTPTTHVYVPVEKPSHKQGHYNKGYRGYNRYKSFKSPRAFYRTSHRVPAYASPSYSRHPYFGHSYRSPIVHPSIISQY